MAFNAHSLGPTCDYYEPEADPSWITGSAAPKVKAQFFYVSSLPIDDPLSPLPPVSDKPARRHPPQPFSQRDNGALEEAWQAFQKEDELQRDTKSGKNKLNPPREIFSFPKFKSAKSPALVSPAAETSFNDFGTKTIEDQPARTVQPEPYRKISNPLSQHRESTKSFPMQSKDFDHIPAPSKLTSDENSKPVVEETHASQTQVMLSQDPDDQSENARPVDARELAKVVQLSQTRGGSNSSPFRRSHKDEQSGTTSPDRGSASGSNEARVVPQPTSAAMSTMSGRPFARASSKRNVNQMTDGMNENYEDFEESTPTHGIGPVSSRKSRDLLYRDHQKAFVPVGSSRLHVVEMPSLMMKPIYWSPINDQSNVVRGTWFFKDSMLPVPAEVANLLEIGYEDLKPYNESYQDELDACIENGAAAELKLVHKLWPEKKSTSRPGTVDNGKDELVVAEPSRPETRENEAADARETQSDQLFRSSSVMYVSRNDAQILKPNQLPSTTRNRKPLGAIRKGRHIGVPVVRGFDRNTWFKLHPDPQKNQKAAKAAIGAYMSQSGDATTRSRRMSCPVCNKTTPVVSDLVLVIHGIGQKLSERVDSFHFTHAINSLRREFNVELASEAIKGNLRRDPGMMVLPVNWRLTLSFDEEPKTAKTAAENKYQLSDITPDTLPAVRSLISDVMLDIPYYLSHHKDTMTSAVVKEANRVYRLWCKNNPGFQEHGRVHLVAHSLGSAMATDILSQQPTSVPRDIDLNNDKVSHKMFEFDTTNLFCCGSPSGLFLLLNGANLIPRRGRSKPGTEGEDRVHGIAGEASYGCLAVDNIYNICHRNDPISYLQNPCVDQSYANSLVPITIPSATVGIFERFGNTLRWTSSSASAAYGTVAGPQRPQMHSMPSTVEMETHNFTQEEIAEKRMYLLNDNGQIDYFLNSGGGPLEIQYLNMLSAHSSYWVLQDFVRFLVVEIGREPGRNGTIPVLRARKKREYKRGLIA